MAVGNGADHDWNNHRRLSFAHVQLQCCILLRLRRHHAPRHLVLDWPNRDVVVKLKQQAIDTLVVVAGWMVKQKMLNLTQHPIVVVLGMLDAPCHLLLHEHQLNQLPEMGWKAFIELNGRIRQLCSQPMDLVGSHAVARTCKRRQQHCIDRGAAAREPVRGRQSSRLPRALK